eukprot:UN09131
MSTTELITTKMNSAVVNENTATEGYGNNIVDENTNNERAGHGENVSDGSRESEDLYMPSPNIMTPKGNETGTPNGLELNNEYKEKEVDDLEAMYQTVTGTLGQ